jgi:large subunit ribosomal protein L14e
MLCPYEGGLNVPAIEVGRICAKLTGREAGRKCVIVDIMDRSFVLITGPKTVTGIKRRRANINHIEPIQDKIEIKRGASDEEVAEALKASGKLEEMAQKIKPALAPV